MIKLAAPTAQAMEAFEKLYLASFPPEERRPWQQIARPEDARGRVCWPW